MPVCELVGTRGGMGIYTYHVFIVEDPIGKQWGIKTAAYDKLMLEGLERHILIVYIHKTFPLFVLKKRGNDK